MRRILVTALATMMVSGAAISGALAQSAGIGGDEVKQGTDYPGYCNRDWKGEISCFRDSRNVFPAPTFPPGLAHIMAPASGNANTVMARHRCGAVLVAPDWALTAAHCVSGRGIVGKFSVGVGYLDYATQKPSSSGVALTIREIVIHPKYRGGKNDLALVRFDEDPSVHVANPRRSPASPAFGGGNLSFPRPDGTRVPAAGKPDFPFADIITTGHARPGPGNAHTILFRWSRTREDGLVLFKTPLFEQSPDHCDMMRTSGMPKVDKTTICALSHDRPVCPSDAGMPVMGGGESYTLDSNGNHTDARPDRELLVVAITTWDRDTCAGPGEPGRFTVLSHYVDWIRDTVKQSYDRRKRASVNN